MSYLHIGTRRMLSLSIITILVKLASLAAVLAFVHGPDDALRFALLNFGANGLIALANFGLNVKKLPLALPTRTALAARFRRSLPFATTVFLALALERFDVFLVEDLLGARGAGLYGCPVRIAQAMVHVVAAVGAVFFAEVVATKTREELSRDAHLGLWVMLAIALPLAGMAPYAA
jgi:O-antigen/teichoic acid export membrane protein